MTEIATVERADGLLRAKEYAAALEAYRSALEGQESASAEICIGVARCHLALQADSAAVPWLLRVVDSGEDFRHWQAAAGLMDRVLKGKAAQNALASKRQARAWLTGSYTLVQLAPLLRLAALRAGVRLEIGEGAYGQFQQDAIDPNSALYRFKPDVVILALHHGAIGLPPYADKPEDTVAAAVASVTSLWKAIRSRSDARIVATNIAAPLEEAFGHLATRVPGARRRLIRAFNDGLADAAAAHGGVSILDCESLSGLIGKRTWFDDRYWHVSKQAVSFGALPMLARHLSAVVAAELGLSKKCLVLDLDNTLWGGVIGEDGLAGIKIGQGDPKSEAFLAFQQFVKGLQAKGVILAVCSKNNDADAREPFVKHPEMALKLDDFAMFVANWERKSDNLVRIVKGLNIGLDSLVFVDDNPVEREIVRQFLPDVDVVNLPPDPSGYVRALSDYLLFETSAFTAEDASKTAQYRARSQIAELEQSATSISDFHRSLQMRAVVAPFDDLHMPRIVQLIGKTNQFNLTTRRYSEAELRNKISRPEAVHFYLRLQDRFTDHGLVSLILGQCGERSLDIDLWLMSCRVIGRTVEAELLSRVCEAAESRGLGRITGSYIPTAKNAMVANVYKDFGFELVGAHEDGTTFWEYDLARQGPITNGFIEAIDQDQTDLSGGGGT